MIFFTSYISKMKNFFSEFSLGTWSFMGLDMRKIYLGKTRLVLCIVMISYLDWIGGITRVRSIHFYKDKF